MTFVLFYAACVFATLSIRLSVVHSNSVFYMKLEEFENYPGLLSTHQKCDSGRPCDPAFVIKVKGSWGEMENASDCYADMNYIEFGSRIGTTLPNPMAYPESSIHFPISIDIRVKDCLFNRPSDDIADFYEDLTHLPRPYLYGETADPKRDTDRVTRLDISSLSPAPMTTKLRITVWHKCTMYYYGNDCTKFCKAVQPGYECSKDGLLVCSSTACQPQTSATSSTTQSTTSASTTATVTTITAAPKLTSTTPLMQTTKRESDGQTTTNIATTRHYSIASSVPASAADLQTVTRETLLATMAALLLAVLIAVAAVLVLIKLCARRGRPSAVPVVNSVRFNRHEIGLESSGGEGQNFVNSSAYARVGGGTTPTTTTDEAAIARPDSGVYEEPVDPTERDLPPLPERDAMAAARLQQQQLLLCRSFSSGPAK